MVGTFRASIRHVIHLIHVHVFVHDVYLFIDMYMHVLYMCILHSVSSSLEAYSIV